MHGLKTLTKLNAPSFSARRVRRLSRTLVDEARTQQKEGAGGFSFLYWQNYINGVQDFTKALLATHETPDE